MHPPKIAIAESINEAIARSVIARGSVEAITGVILDRLPVVILPQPPRRTSPDFLSIKLDTDTKTKAKSTKLANLIINLRDVCSSGAESLFYAFEAFEFPWLLPFAILIIVEKFNKLLSIQFSEKHSIVLWAMWTIENEQSKKTTQNLLRHTNGLLRDNDHPAISKLELSTLLEDLENAKTVLLEGASWRLRERIIISFTPR
jgi:hypothetical protein